MIESKQDSSRENRLLELFLMGMLSQPELEAELARPAEPESSGREFSILLPSATAIRCR
jgi:hypothetical protein